MEFSLLERNVPGVLDLPRGLPLGLHLLSGLRDRPEVLVSLVALLASREASLQLACPALDLRAGAAAQDVKEKLKMFYHFII